MKFSFPQYYRGIIITTIQVIQGSFTRCNLGAIKAQEVIAPLVYGLKRQIPILLCLYCASIAPSRKALNHLYCGGYCALSVWLKTVDSYFIVPLLRLYCTY